MKVSPINIELENFKSTIDILEIYWIFKHGAKLD